MLDLIQYGCKTYIFDSLKHFELKKLNNGLALNNYLEK